MRAYDVILAGVGRRRKHERRYAHAARLPSRILRRAVLIQRCPAARIVRRVRLRSHSPPDARLRHLRYTQTKLSAGKLFFEDDRQHGLRLSCVDAGRGIQQTTGEAGSRSRKPRRSLYQEAAAGPCVQIRDDQDQAAAGIAGWTGSFPSPEGRRFRLNKTSRCCGQPLRVLLQARRLDIRSLRTRANVTPRTSFFIARS